LKTALAHASAVSSAVSNLAAAHSESSAAHASFADQAAEFGDVLSGARDAGPRAEMGPVWHDESVDVQISVATAEVCAAATLRRFSERTNAMVKELKGGLESRERVCAALKKKYISVKGEYGRVMRELEEMPNEESKQTEKEGLEAKKKRLKEVWQKTETDLTVRLDELVVEISQAVNSFVTRYALLRLELMTKLAKSYIEPAEKAKALKDIISAEQES